MLKREYRWSILAVGVAMAMAVGVSAWTKAGEQPSMYDREVAYGNFIADESRRAIVAAQQCKEPGNWYKLTFTTSEGAVVTCGQIGQYMGLLAHLLDAQKRLVEKLATQIKIPHENYL
jgi:hypothetical protein